METHDEIDVALAVGAPDGSLTVETIHLEIEIEDRLEPICLALPGGERFLDAIREHVGLTVETHIFEHDKDHPLTGPISGRKTIRLVGHRCREVTVEVRYDQHVKHHKVAPARTVFKVLQWAIGKHGFDLDPLAAAKANLILPGADAPLPREAAIGKFAPAGHCTLVVDLTLQDFTNGAPATGR